ncbi:biofilm and cell wall regulator 1 [Ceratobasidium sp. AG-Ba]|nr:biofilm and cell wall regulator 1 [Ceratobasidium sp. AG-Ba]
MKEEAPPTPPAATTPPNAMAKADSASPVTQTTSLADDAVPRSKKAGVGPVRTRAAPSKTFVCRGFGDCSMVFSRSEHLARHHAQTVHSDKLDLNERMMRELTSLHTALAATSHRNLPRLSPSQPNPSQPSRSQPSTPIDGHPGSAGVVPSMAYDTWRRDDFRNESFLGQSFPASQSFRTQQPFQAGSFPASHPHGAYPDPRFPVADLHAHPAGRPVGRFLAPGAGHDGPFQRPDPRGEYDRPGLEGFDPRDRSVDDGGGSKPFTSGGSAGGGLPPISSLIPRAEQSQSLLPAAAGRPATAGGLASWRPSSGAGRPASSSGWLPPLADRPSLAHRPATAAAPLGIGSAASSRPGTSGGVGGYDRDRDVFAFEPPALAAPRLRTEDDDSARARDEYGYRLPFGLRPGTAPAASFDRGGRGREWERERPRYGRDESHERYRHERDESSDGRQSSSRDRSRERYAPLGRPARDDWRDERSGVAVSGLAASSSDEQSPDSTMELRRRGSGGLYPGDADRDPGLLSPGGGGYDSPFSWHPPGLAPRKRSYDFGPGDANDGSDSRPASRRLTLMELCSTGPAGDDDAPTPELSSADGKPTSERGREPAHVIRPATVSGLGDSAGGLPGIASFGYGSGTIRERDTVSGRGSSLPPPPSPPPTAMGERDDDGASLRRLELYERRDASTRFPGRESADGFEHDKLRGDTGTGVSDTAVRASASANHWRGEHERLRDQVRTPISPPPTATGVRAGSAS